MSHQSEATLENNLIKQLIGLNYASVKIQDGDALVSNLKSQLEVFNETNFTNKEFDAVLNHLAKGNVFEKAKTLRDRFQLTKEDGTSFYVRYFNADVYIKNLYQVTNQISLEGSYKNRFDVTLLVNGLPLVQIELKRSGIEIKEAFNQINRYQMHSFWSNHGLFQYVQLFIISNGVNTKYLANLPQLARQRLEALGMRAIFGNDGGKPWCTVSNASRFFSHRRDAGRLGSSGRLAASIWRDA